MSALFVSGTDTGVGKTTVSAAILAAARRRGLTTAATKPIETGCTSDGPMLLPADGALLRAAAGGHQSLDEVCPLRFAEPLAPAIAARRTGHAIELADVIASCRAVHARRSQLTLVEGAGGWLVPLTDRATIADLAAALGFPVLIVARDDLGTINHTSMTVECVRARGLDVAGVVLSAARAGASAEAVADNAAAIERSAGVPVLGHLPRLTDLSLAGLADAAERHLALDRLLYLPMQ